MPFSLNPLLTSLLQTIAQTRHLLLSLPTQIPPRNLHFFLFMIWGEEKVLENGSVVFHGSQNPERHAAHSIAFPFASMLSFSRPLRVFAIPDRLFSTALNRTSEHTLECTTSQHHRFIFCNFRFYFHLDLPIHVISFWFSFIFSFSCNFV